MAGLVVAGLTYWAWQSPEFRDVLKTLAVGIGGGAAILYTARVIVFDGEWYPGQKRRETARAEREARIVARLKNQHMCPFHPSEQHKGRCCWDGCWCYRTEGT